MKKFKTYTMMLGSSSWTAINNNLTRAFGDITISAVYSRLLSLQEYFGENKDFFQTYEQISTYFGINEYQASKAVLFLVKNGFISCRKKGLPSRPYYLFTESNFDLVQQLLESIDNEGKNLDATNAKMTTVVSLNPESLQVKYDNPIISKSKESKSKEVNNTLLPVFSKNEPAQSEIDLLNAKIARLEALIERQSNTEADGAKCNNVANNELAVLSSSIGTSYVSTQESKDKPVKARKNANSATITIEQDANFASFEVFAEKWDKVLAAKYPKLDASLVYEWFVPAVQARYNGTYKDHFAALRTWLGRSSDAELSKLSKFKPTEQYNNEGLINGIIERTKGQPTTMDKIDAKAKEVWEKYMNDQNNK